MVDPPPWPERPDNAQDFDLFWVVRGLPPLPFPDESYDYASDRAHFGPPGTRWVYSVEALIARQTAPGTPQGVKAAIARLLLGQGGKLPPAGSAGWVVPGTPPPNPVYNEEGLMPMSWIRTAIVGQIGQDEEVVHILNWRHSTTENAPVGANDVKILATHVRNSWGEFMAQTGSTWAPPQLKYTEVRGSVLTQVNPNEKPSWPLPTQVVSFGANLVGTAVGNPLPYEVACCLSLNTNWRGTSRFRGRLYLGPLAASLMTTDGQFGSSMENVAFQFGEKMIGAVEAVSDYELHVISQKYNTSAKITGVRVGRVPDSQRRRRRDRPENYFQAWGQPVGAN